MKQIKIHQTFLFLVICCFSFTSAYSQQTPDSSLLSIDRIFNSRDFMPERFGQVQWLDDGQYFTKLKYEWGPSPKNSIEKIETKSAESSVLVSCEDLTPEGDSTCLVVSAYSWSDDMSKLLIFTNTKRVWRYNTKGDYWIMDAQSKKLHQLGKGLPESSLMFAKFSPDGDKAAYLSGHNIYVESLTDGSIKQLTFDGTEDIINGTFDWAYEEEFHCRDGFRWSPDGKKIAFWQIDASGIKDFMMINNTDSIYSYTIPVQYPKVGQTPSSAKIAAVDIESGAILWMNIEGDPYQNYLPRILWGKSSEYIYTQQLNRKQNTNNIWKCDARNGESTIIYTEKDNAWLDTVDDWVWTEDGKYFTWLSEADGWRHLYLISADGKDKKKLTPDPYDIIEVLSIDPSKNTCYYIATPDNPTQRYLFKASLKDSQNKRITPAEYEGTNSYNISPGGKYAFHSYSNANTPNTRELIKLPSHKNIRTVTENQRLKQTWSMVKTSPIEFFKVTTEDDVEMDGFIIKPYNFDPNKKYPVLFFVYGEPWGQTATDRWDGSNYWHHMLAQKGYIVISMDNRGTPCPKGREWRKSIYRKIGVINSRDQAMAAKEIMKWDFIDTTRIAVWGWSGGGSMTLNLMFRYPEIYKTGMAVAPVSNQLYYDNIYQERYMGLPQENMEDFIEGSPISYAKNLKGNLLIVHGTGDDNVHYQNTEKLINELILHNKQFQVMPYPNRSHGIYEGRNTTRHLYTLLTNYLMNNMPAEN